ncbi:MAG: hypothetical protein H0U35_06635 [Sporichthyaceae bacterium]|nr:hypothetical protein [Sporichthyaceae bacterium]
MNRRPSGAHRRARESRSQRRSAAGLIALVLGTAIVLSGPVGARAAMGVPVTYAGPTYDTTVKRPSENKPQSKLWYAAGAWWGLLVSQADDRVHIFELMPNHTWRDTGVQVDDRLNSTGDAHWDATESRLTVASRGDGSLLRVARFTLSPSRIWSKDSGFPVTVNTGGGSESAAIDRDSTGRFWVTYTRSSTVWVAASNDASGLTWSAGFKPNVPDVTIKSDDISSVISFRGRIGVMWSDQQSHAFRMALHVDGTPDSQWTVEDALAGTNLADDHINLKTVADDGQGRVYAAVKTSQDSAGPSAPLVGVLIRTPEPDGSGSWDFIVAGTVADDHTRPIIQIDKTNQELYFFATAPVSGGDIYYKKTSLANPSFGPGRGAKFLDATPVVNNVTGSKQPVTAETGMVVLAVAEGKKQYYHAEMELAGGTSPPPDDTAPPSTPTGLTATPSAGKVDLTWTASTDASGISGYVLRRDGVVLTTVSGTSYADLAVTAGQTYGYTVQARDNAGNYSGQSTTVNATVPTGEPPPAGGAVSFRDATEGANNAESTVTVARPASQEGDVLVATIDYRGQSAITAPTGWTLIRLDANGTAMRKATYWRLATSSEPASYAWTFGAKPAAVGSILAYAGVSGTAPVESSGGVVASSTSVSAPSVAASQGSVVIGLFGVARSAAISQPGGTTERTEIVSPSTTTYPMTGETADRTQATTGSTGTLVAQSSVSGPNIGHVVVLRGAS